MAGNTKAWLMTNSRKELSFSGHTHSGYASSSHTHSQYALTTHTHTGYAASNHTHSQYVTEVDINSMIEDVIDSYVPTILNALSYGVTGSSRINGVYPKRLTINIPSGAKILLIYLYCTNGPWDFAMSIYSNGNWYSFMSDRHGRTNWNLTFNSSSVLITLDSGSFSENTVGYVWLK